MSKGLKGVLPVRFGNVAGYFNCSQNELLSLNGCPDYVGYGFYCSYNLLSLQLKSPPTTFGQPSKLFNLFSLQ